MGHNSRKLKATYSTQNGIRSKYLTLHSAPNKCVGSPLVRILNEELDRMVLLGPFQLTKLLVASPLLT